MKNQITLMVLAVLFCQLSISQSVYIGGTAYVDSDNNGMFDFTDNNIAEEGITLTMDLLDADSVVIKSINTDVDGRYLFETTPGYYRIRFVPAARFPFASSIHSSIDDDIDGDSNGSQVDTDADGITDGVIVSPLIELVLGDEPLNEPDSGHLNDENSNHTIDFGVLPEGFFDDCPGLMANIGDACDDGDTSTEYDYINFDCECVGVTLSDAECPDPITDIFCSQWLIDSLVSLEPLCDSNATQIEVHSLTRGNQTFIMIVENSLPVDYLGGTIYDCEGVYQGTMVYGIWMPPFGERYNPPIFGEFTRTELGNCKDGYPECSDFTDAVEEIGVNDISLYPIPTITALHIDVTTLTDYQLSLLNLEGRVLFSGRNVREIDTSSLTNGTYILKIRSNEKQFGYTRKIVVMH